MCQGVADFDSKICHNQGTESSSRGRASTIALPQTVGCVGTTQEQPGSDDHIPINCSPEVEPEYTAERRGDLPLGTMLRVMKDFVPGSEEWNLRGGAGCAAVRAGWSVRLVATQRKGMAAGWWIVRANGKEGRVPNCLLVDPDENAVNSDGCEPGDKTDIKPNDRPLPAVPRHQKGGGDNTATRVDSFQHNDIWTDADDALEPGSIITVEGMGAGHYVGFRKRRLGANVHLIQFGLEDNPREVRLKGLNGLWLLSPKAANDHHPCVTEKMILRFQVL